MKVDRPTLRKVVKDSDVVAKSKLSAGFVDQCIDKVLWTWRSYRALHKDWEYSYQRAIDRLESARDDKEKEKAKTLMRKLENREPRTPRFEEKTSCRFDYRTGTIERGENTFLLWMHVSTLKKGTMMDIPLNPSAWHLRQLEGVEVNNFEIIKSGKKYYAHISITRRVDT